MPILVVDGDADRVLPYPKTGKRLPGLIKEMELVVIEGGPHAIAWTHADLAAARHRMWPGSRGDQRHRIPPK